MKKIALYTLLLTAFTNTPLHAQEEATIYESGFEYFQVETVLEDLDLPWGLAFLPDGQALISERSPANVLLVDFETGEKIVLKGLPEIYDEGDAGFRDIIIHPDYEKNGWVYFSYAIGSEEGSTLSVDRAKIKDDTIVERENIFTLEPLATWEDHYFHYGARLVLKDGFLFITVGDRHNQNLAQDLGVINGSIIRLHEDGRVPTDNPFVNTEGIRPEIWSYGHRNPQGLAFDPNTGRLWSTEHGPLAGDEVNLIKPGRNYGWPIITYGKEYSGEPVGKGLTHKEGMEQPRLYLPLSFAPSDLMFYSGDIFKNWQGSAFFGSIGRHRYLHRIVLEDSRVIYSEALIEDLEQSVRFVRQGPDGFLYIGTDEGNILRLVPTDQ